MGTICYKRIQKNTPKEPLLKAPVNQQNDSTSQSMLESSRPAGKRTQKSKAKFVLPRTDSFKDAPSAQIMNKPKSESDRKIILACLNRHFVLRTLDPQTKEHIIHRMVYYKVDPRQVIFEQGDPPQSFFVISSGRLEVIVDGERKDILKLGQGFGELALLDDCPRSATIKSLEKCSLWGLDFKTFKEVLKNIHEQNFEEIMGFINSVHLLDMLTIEQKTVLVNSLTPQYWSTGQKIVKEGDNGDLFYIIKEGTVLCSEKGKELRLMSKGDYFGELALLYHSTRTATVTCQTEVKLLSINRDHLIEVLGSDLDLVIYKNSLRIIFDKSPALKVLTHEQIENALNTAKIRTFHDGELVINASTPTNSCIYMVIKGSLRSSSQSYGVFSCLGGEFLENASTFKEDLFSEGDTHVSVISKEQFEEAIGGNYEQIVKSNTLLKIFMQIPLLRGLPVDKLRQLMKVMELQEFSDKSVIVEQNTPGDSFYIVQSGTVDIVKDDVVIRTISTWDFFGERSVLFGDIRTANVISHGPVSCWVLSKDNLQSVIDEGIRKQLMKRIDLQDDTIQLQDLVPVKVLGKGMFGHVYLTFHKSKQTFYSLKTVSRSKIEAYEIYDNILLERKILLQLDHFMIVKLVKTFKDDKRLYFLLEYVQGMDLFDVLRHLNLVKENDSKFYTGCLILMIEYLHERHIIYRDLKPENVMIDEDGYPKLVDFGTAKIISGRTYSTIGTPHYMAPEVILGSGYTAAVDWWSIGIMLYEFLYGALPFGENDNDPELVYEKILDHRLSYPSYSDPMSPVRPLIQQLLSKNPNSRGTAFKLKSHRWFANFDWKMIISKKATPPYVPKLPNLNVEVEQAKEKMPDLFETLEFEEGSLENFGRKGRRRPPPTDWDAEF